MNTISVTNIEPLSHATAMDLLAGEFARTNAMLASFDGDDWSARTDCPEWDVRQMYLHVLGASEAGASMRENVHQLRAGYRHRKQRGGPLEAALSAVQIREREQLGAPEIVTRMEAIAPKTVGGRRRVPSLVRNHAKMAIDGPVYESWTLGYLIDTIYLRDMWMHRVDASRATGRPLDLSEDHDGRIVGDVVAEWARRHGGAFALELTGPAGGTFADEPESTDAEHLTLDAIEFCRTLAGRNPDRATGLINTVVPF
jgi:uncharacterized protein (TIGR03083 family)